MDAPDLAEDLFQLYRREVCTIPPLTHEEEAELTQHVRAHDEHEESAAKRLIEANLAMVVSVAESHRGEGMHLLDLAQKGNDALLLALQTFPAESEQPFSVHAAACVRAAIAQAVAGETQEQRQP